MILELLIKNQNKVFSKANLYESIWHEEYIGDDNAIKTHISNIRSKLKKFNPNENYIETVWGLGYRLFKSNLSNSLHLIFSSYLFLNLFSLYFKYKIKTTITISIN